MTELNNLAPDEVTRTAEIAEIWNRLSDETKEVAALMAVGDNRVGSDRQFFEDMGIPIGVVDELITTGLAEARGRKDIALEFVNEYGARVKAIRQDLASSSRTATP